MGILEELLEMKKFDFNEHDVMICFSLKSSTNNFFSLTKRGFMTNFCLLKNKIHYEKSHAFEIVGVKISKALLTRFFIWHMFWFDTSNSAVVPTGIGEGQVALTEGAKQLKAFADLGSAKKKKLLLKWLGTKMDKLFPG